ncbi:MAG: ribonuclease HI family protein [bacterium]|nr:ribonuclease HI family protein [bacterium]
MKHKIKIHTDGGARGNPGPAGIGIVIEGLANGKKTFGECIGETTNNEAEYRALIVALQKLKKLGGKEKLEQVDCYADSELMVKQLNGEYKVKDTNLRGLFMEVLKLKSELKAPIFFHHVKRAKNAEADALMNQALDREAGKLNL